VTNALRGGMNPLLVQQIVGHSSLRMIESVYSHLTTSDSHRAMMQLLARARE
jgi:integrase